MKTILFICTGNTCRSPMAECMFNALCQKEGRTDLRAVSAGMNAFANAPASEGARRAMRRRGLSLAEHRSQPLTERLLRDVSLVVGMTQGHVDAAMRMYPNVNIPMRVFNSPIADPYGGSDEAYEHAAREIGRQLPALLT